MPQARKIAGQCEDLGLLLRRDDTRLLALKLGSLGLTRFEAKQRVVPTPLKGSGDQSVSGIALLIALLGESGLILSTFNAHLPLTHDGLIALLKFLQRCYGQFEFGRLSPLEHRFADRVVD